MNSWQKTLVEAIRDDYVRRAEGSCAYRYFEEKALANPRVQIKGAWAKGVPAEERTRLLARLAGEAAQPAGIDGIGLLCGVDVRGAASKRQANARALEALGRIAAGEETPGIAEEDLARVARALCRAGGKAGKGTTVQAFSGMCDLRAGGNALVVGDEAALPASSERELAAEARARLHHECKQLLLNMGVPVTGRSPAAAPRVSEVPTRLIELALKEIEHLPRALGIAAAASTPSADQCSEADVMRLADGLGTRFGAIVPVCMDAFTGLSLCIVSVDFSFDLSQGQCEARFKGGAPQRAFFAIVPQHALNGLMRASRDVPEEEYPTEEMVSGLWGFVADAWVADGQPAHRPLRRLANMRGKLEHVLLPPYVARNSSAPDGCPEPAARFFERL